MFLRTDAKPVSIVALGCFHPAMKVQSASIHFFLGSDEEREDSDDEEEEVRLRLLILFFYDLQHLRQLM